MYYMAVLVDEHGNMLAGELAEDIFYKDVAIAGVSITNYYAAVNTGVDASKYKAIGVSEVDGTWDTNLTCSVGTGNYLLLRSARTQSYTIASGTKPIRVYFVKANRLNPTPLT